MAARLTDSLAPDGYYDSVSAATAAIGRYLTLDNTRRPHSSLDDRARDEAYFAPRTFALAA